MRHRFIRAALGALVILCVLIAPFAFEERETVWGIGTFESFNSSSALEPQLGVLAVRGKTARWRAWLYQLGLRR